MAREQLTEIDMNSNKVTSLGTPTAPTDATTKAYVDTADAVLAAQELTDIEDANILYWMGG